MSLIDSWRLLSDCIVPQPATPAVWQETIANEAVPSTSTWCALFSNRSRPLLLPANNHNARKSAIRFFLPEWWRKYYADLRLRANECLGERARLPLLTLPSASGPTLADPLAVTKSQQLAFLIGTPGPYQKASMLAMTSRGEPLSLTKIALGAQANQMVESEARWLRKLSEYPAMTDSVPKLFYEGNSCSGYRYVAQSIVSGRSCINKFTPQHAEFLRRLSAIECQLLQFSHSPFYHTLRESFARFAPLLDSERYTQLEATLNHCCWQLNNWYGPFVIGHGDFAFWNIRVADGGIRVFDWEYANAGTLPLFDLFHFHLIAPATSDRQLRGRNIKRALASARAYALLAYPEFDWRPEIVAAQALAYLLYTLVFYGISRGEFVESHPVVRSYYRLIEQRAQWIR